MKILRITPHYYFESDDLPAEYEPVGGMQVQIYTLSNWLSEQGITQDILTTGLPQVARTLNTNNNLTVHSIRTWVLPIKSKYDGILFLNESWALGILKWLLTHRVKGYYDAIHVHLSGVMSPLLISILIKKFYPNIPLILTIHCSRRFTYQPMNKWDAFVNRIAIKLEDKAIKICNQSIVLTQKTNRLYRKTFSQYVNKFSLGEDSLSQVHMNHVKGGCCDTLFSQYKFFYTKKPYILFVGRVAHEKGWERFIELANQLQFVIDCNFIICGDGPQANMAKKMIHKYGLSDRFLLTGFVKHHFVPCFLSNARLLIIPSKHEEFGGVFLEGLAAKVPIIAAKVGGLKENLTHMFDAWLVNDDIKEYFEAALQLFNNTILANKLIINGYETTLHKFQNSFSFKNILNSYKVSSVLAKSANDYEKK